MMAKLGSNDHLRPEGTKGLTQQFFIGKRAVNLSSIKESDAAFYRSVEKRNHLLFIFRRAVGKTHSHTAKPNRRDFQVTFAKFSLLHI